MQGDERRVHPAGEAAIRGVDLLLAIGAGVARLARATIGEPLAATATGVLQLGAGFVTDESRHPRVADLTARGQQLRIELERSATEALRGVLRWGVERALRTLDLTTLVLLHVDLDALAAGIDVDAVVARTDLDAALETMDLDAILARVDLDAILSRVDLNELASRIDLDAILSRVDLNEVASRIDLDAIVQRVEPDAVVARVDIEAVLGRLDLAAITREVLEAIDIAAMLRESGGAVSSQAARVVRTEGMNADDSVARFVDRVLRRSNARAAVAP